MNAAPRLSSLKPKRPEAPRLSAARRGYGAHWQKARARYLKEHPLCVICLRDKIVKTATVVDHIVPHKGNQDLFWDEDNWQSSCKEHHDIKTAKEDGGFGHHEL